jgi:molecular chaperone GrpE
MTPRDADLRRAGQAGTPGGPAGRSGPPPAGPGDGAPGTGPGRDPAAGPSPDASTGPGQEGPDLPGQEGRDLPGQEAHDSAAQEAADLRARVAELEDRWRRTLADLDNLRKRSARDAATTQAAERARAAGEWLPVLDNLDLALQHAEADPGAIVKGVEAVRDQALSVLAGLGFARRDDDVGAPFDPARHEAAATVAEPDAPEGTVVRVLRPGYGEGERQLRPATVVVATKAP